MKRVLEQTADGSATLFIPEMDEHYHSVKGARTESQHIFVDMGLKALTKDRVRVLEVGFGTGLNALLTLQATDELNVAVDYIGIELYPLSWEMVNALNYSDSPLFELLHTIPWEQPTIISNKFTLTKVEYDINKLFVEQGIDKKEEINKPFDLIYFDAFAPEKQPEMW